MIEKEIKSSLGRNKKIPHKTIAISIHEFRAKIFLLSANYTMEKQFKANGWERNKKHDYQIYYWLSSKKMSCIVSLFTFKYIIFNKWLLPLIRLTSLYTLTRSVRNGKCDGRFKRFSFRFPWKIECFLACNLELFMMQNNLSIFLV